MNSEFHEEYEHTETWNRSRIETRLRQLQGQKERRVYGERRRSTETEHGRTRQSRMGILLYRFRCTQWRKSWGETGRDCSLQSLDWGAALFTAPLSKVQASEGEC